MSNDCWRRDTCRLCGGGILRLVLSLTPTPPANAFVAEAAKDKEQPCFPLDVFYCEACKHVQLLDVVDPGLDRTMEPWSVNVFDLHRIG